MENEIRTESKATLERRLNLTDLKELGKALGSWVATATVALTIAGAIVYGSYKFAEYQNAWAKSQNLVPATFSAGGYIPASEVVPRQ